MNYCKRNIVVPALVFASALAAVAVPARRDPFTVVQPDGTELTVRLVGDEYFHYYLTDDDHVLVNVDDIFFYGKADADRQCVVSTGVLAHEAIERTAMERELLMEASREQVMTTLSAAAAVETGNRRDTRRAAAGPGLFPGCSFPSIGEQKVLVVLVEYTDVKFNLTDPHDYFSRMLSEQGFKDYGGTGSARDYFIENSNGKFVPEFDVYGPLTLAHDMKYYGANDYSGNDVRPEQMIIEACRQLDDEVDFTEYDRDGDGMIDNVFVFYAGRGEANGGSSNTVWPHSFDIALLGQKYFFDGVQLNRYACSNEWNSSRPDGVGTFIHEFSHVMGLPDLYTTNYASAFTPGAWSVLDYGPYNNDGCTPPLYSAFERYALGWIEPQVLDRPAVITLNAISSNEACIIPTSRANEFFLLENRQQTGWDAYIPGHGMLAWHIDYNEAVWNNNAVNNSASHQYVDLEEADNVMSEYSRAGDSFPGTAGITSFTDETKPSMKTWKGVSLGVPITAIAEKGGVITFNVMGGRPAPAAVDSVGVRDVTPRGFTVGWRAVEEADYYRVTVTAAGSDEPVGKYDGLNVGDVTTFAVTDLEPETAYKCVVTAENSGGAADPSAAVEAVTTVATFDYMRTEAQGEASASDSFEITWQPVEGADSYIVDVYTKKRGNFDVAECDFTGGIAGIPEGWITDSRMTYGGNAYCGVAAPSLRLNRESSIETPVFDDDIHSLTFWNRGSGVTELNRLEISAYSSISRRWTLHSTCAVVSKSGGGIVTVDDLPVGTRAARITHSAAGTGAVAVDDIVVEWGGSVTEQPVDGYTALPVSATSLTVSGVTPGNVYYFVVTAVKGDMKSLPSVEAFVSLEGNGGVDRVETAGDVTVKCDGRHVSVVAAEAVPVVVTDIAGRVVTTATGSFDYDLPSAGIYIVRAGATVVKIVVR